MAERGRETRRAGTHGEGPARRLPRTCAGDESHVECCQRQATVAVLRDPELPLRCHLLYQLSAYVSEQAHAASPPFLTLQVVMATGELTEIFFFFFFF